MYKINRKFLFTEKFEITFEEFLQILDESWTLVNNDREGLRRALQRFGQTKEGFVDIEKFREAMRTLGEPLTDDEIDEIVQISLNDEERKLDIESNFFCF